jgi:Fur family transcriptional regulator, ferric uptake regulator
MRRLAAEGDDMPVQTDDALRDAGLRATRQRLTVLEALRGRRDAVTAQDLHAELRAAHEPVGLTTVYRTLTALAEAGFLDTFTREGEQAFRLCSEAHHHHLVCEVCGTVEELESELVEEWVTGVVGRRGFQVTGHRADIFGICSSCA